MTMTAIQSDRVVLAPLAEAISELSRSKRNRTKRARWRDSYRREQPDSPPIYVLLDDTAWAEILDPADLSCRTPEGRDIEFHMKKALLLDSWDDDTPVESIWRLPATFTVEPANIWGLDIIQIEPDEPGGAWHTESPIKSGEDFDRLVMPVFSYDSSATESSRDVYAEILDGAMDVEIVGDTPVMAITSRFLGELRGLTEMMMDTILAPELIHKLMSYLNDVHFRAMDALEASGFVSPWSTNIWYESDPFGPDPGVTGYSFMNRWVRMHGQEFDQISPEMCNEFLFPYQREIAKRYGRVEYGCCESLNGKMDSVLGFPNLALVNCSPFSDLEYIVDKAKDRCVIQWRQRSTDIFYVEDNYASGWGGHLRRGFETLRGCFFQIGLREIPGLNGRPERIGEFISLARELC